MIWHIIIRSRIELVTFNSCGQYERGSRNSSVDFGSIGSAQLRFDGSRCVSFRFFRSTRSASQKDVFIEELEVDAKEVVISLIILEV